MTYKNFSEFHGSVTKQMPDVTRYPEMYNLCYDLMKMSWDAAKASDVVLDIRVNDTNKRKIADAWIRGY